MPGRKKPKIVVPVQRFLDPPSNDMDSDSGDDVAAGMQSGQRSPPPGWRRKVATLQPRQGK